LKITVIITSYNQKAHALDEVKGQLEELNTELTTKVTWPSNTYYSEKQSQLSRIRSKLPSSDIQAFGKYGGYTCASQLSQDIHRVRQDIQSLENKFGRAEALVPQINQLRRQGNYPEILRLIKQYPNLTFFSKQYAELDELSLKQQRESISSALRVNDFRRAENALRYFDQDQNFLNPGTIVPRKNILVEAFEDSLFNKVERVSLQTSKTLIEQNLTTVDKVDSLYSNPGFFPAYTFTYSRMPGLAAQKNQTLTNKMDYIRTQKLPESAIEELYRSLTNAIHDRGVEKARAIVAHGQYYKGEQNKIKNLIAECDPAASKWLTKPREYRKIYALPVTSNIRGSNQYMAKINLQIPSDAKFPGPRFQPLIIFVIR